MSSAPVEVYGRALTEAAGEAGHVSFRAVGDDGSQRRLPLRRWLGRVPIEELELLERASSPVLDVGCGPGRHLAGLARLGVPGLGLDIAPHAVALARARGCRALRRSVFDRLPNEGSWGSALLLDGNVGIAGDPERLLGRLAALLRPGGTVFAEFEPPQARSREVRIRVETLDEVSDWFPWAWVSVDDVDRISRSAGLDVAAIWTGRGRWVAQLDVPR